MKKQQYDNKTKTLIFNSAKDLFMTKGYSKTTIRQIIENANVTIGSLYHFYSNKEDILLNIVKDYFEEVIEISTSYANELNKPLLVFSINAAISFKLISKNKNIAELYLAAYNSVEASSYIYDISSQLTPIWFKGYGHNFTHSDYYNRSVLIKGIFQTFISDEFYSGHIAINEKLDLMVQTIYHSFGVPECEIEQVLLTTKSIINSNQITVKGYDL